MLPEPLRFEDAFIELVQLREVEVLERIGFEHAFQKPVRPAPRSVDVEVLALFLAAHHAELSERVVQVPRDELELLRPGPQIGVIILPRPENAVHGREPDRDRHETREFVEVKIIAEFGGKFRIVRVADQFAELNQALFLFVRQVRFRIIRLLVVAPVVAQIGERIGCHRLEERAFPGGKPLLDEVVVHVLDQRVKAEVFFVKLAGDRDVNPGIGRARRRHAGVAKQPVGQNFVHPTRVRDIVMEIEFGQTGQLLALDVLVQIELQRAFERTARLHECAVALVTHRDVAEAMTFHLQIRVDVFKLDPHRRCQAVALAFRAS